MAGKRIVIPNYMPALDLNGNPQAGAKVTFYANETTDLAPIYTSAALTVQHPNPIIADASGVFPSIFADEDAEFSVAITDANDNPIGGLRNRDNIRPSLAFLDGVEAPVSGAMADVLAEDTLSAARAAMGADQAANVNFSQAGAGAVARTAQAKLMDTVAVGDFSSLNLAASSFGTDTPPLVEGAVYIPNGTYPEGFVSGQATRFVGQSRGGTIIQSTSGGTAAVIDARRTRGSSDENTWGGMSVEHLSIDGNAQSRPGVCLYGGGSSIREVTIDGCASAGLQLQYVLKCSVDTVTVQNCSGSGVVIDTDAIHAGDVNTSIKVSNLWCLNNTGWGMELEDTHYSTFTLTTQGNGTGGIRADGTGSVVAASLSFIGCASEVDGGPAFSGKALRDFLIADFFLLANAAHNSFIFDNCTGTVIGLTDTTVHTGGTYTVSIINSGLGAITFIGGNITMDPAQMKFCIFVNCVVNGVLMSSVGRLDVIDANDAQSFYMDTTPLGGDYSGLGVYDAAGLRIAAFRRFSGGMIISSGGATDPAALNNGDFIGYVGTTSLTFQAKGTDGVVRTGTVTLA